MLNNTSLFDLIHYKIGYKIYLFLENKNHTNIIIHGMQGTGKSILIQNILNEKFLTMSIEKKEPLRFYIHPNYYFFNCKFIDNNVDTFISFIRDISYIDNPIMKNIYIVFDHFELLNEKIQNVIKVIIEKSITYKFIIITNQFNKLLPTIKSKGICIRIREPSYIDKYIYLKKYLLQKDISFNQQELLHQCKQEDLNTIIYSCCICTFPNILSEKYIKLRTLIQKPTLIEKDFVEIKKLSIIIKQLNLPIKKLLSLIIHDFDDQGTIQICSNFDYNNIHSYRELIHIEDLIIHLNIHLNNHNNHIKK
tara:strand:- start:6107 stop:7027 length:921 start_codon:yes stop_codon:yes gene_type:complete